MEVSQLLRSVVVNGNGNRADSDRVLCSRQNRNSGSAGRVACTARSA
jgi:hypothetical protein